MKVVASVQVRMGSTRLPGKVMEVVLGRPLLGHLLDRMRLCSCLDNIVVATPDSTENDVIQEFCSSENIACFRGSEDDVLNRTLEALRSQSAGIGVEVFGDCPLIDPRVVDDIVRYFIQNPGYDFVGNDLVTTYPPGMEVEVFSVDALADSDRRVVDEAIREHGTLFIRQHPEIYKIINLDAPEQFHRPELELEIDTIEDLEVIRIILGHFSGRIDYRLEEIIEFLDSNQDVSRLNKNVPRRWKTARDH